MLNFTFNGHDVTGQFNGRFAFRASLDATPLAILTLKEIAEGAETALSIDVVRHEYLHWLCFRHSRFGIECIGRRFRARSAFMAERLTEVTDYYKQRTAYFSSVYRSHEFVVHDIEESSPDLQLSSLRKVSLSRAQRQVLQRADSVARDATMAMGALDSFNSRAGDWVKGVIATREYGLQSYIPESSGGTRIREVSLLAQTQGVVNAAFETQIGNQNLVIRTLKRLRRKLNTEGRGGGLTKEKMGLWAALKFQSEAHTVHRLREYGFPIPFSNFSDYAEQVADFAFRYTLSRPSPVLRRNLVQLICGCMNLDTSMKDLMPYAAKFSEFDDGVLYFFYIHGN